MPQFPTGTVTFVFTDLEGSTRLWESYPELMKNDLARHDAIMRQAIEANGGHVFETAGDAFAAAFPTAQSAITAAMAAQRALTGVAWTVPGGLRARIALHTGTAEERDGNYFGPTLNRAARILSAGHGGQTLLSDVTCDLVREALPRKVTVRDLGLHRLKDLSRPERIHQLVVADLRVEFPPLRSLDLFRHNLPIELTTFVGREREIEEVERLLSTARAVTLAGIGGTGKTRLSLRVAANAVEGFPDGVWQVRLEALSDPAHVAMETASALGVIEQPGRPILATLADQLRGKSLLVVLDNCEHVVAACAELVGLLLEAAPKLKVLATSREPLRIPGEMVFQVPPLSLPDGQPRVGPSELTQFEAIRLFIDRAMTSAPGFMLTDRNAPAVAQICRQLDGIPLAIELAAVRVKVLSPDQIAARLDDRFRLLTGGARTSLPRHQALRATLDWSHDLLSTHERVLLRRLAVFAGGCSLEAVEEVCAGEGLERGQILDLLVGLVDKSLLIPADQRGTVRYRMLETVRQYGRVRLEEAGEVSPIARRHFSFFLGRADAGDPLAHDHFEQVAWLDEMDDEYDNVRSALAWADAEHPEGALRLIEAISLFWLIRGHLHEGREWSERVIATHRDRPSLWLGRGHYVASLLVFRQGDLARAAAHAEESVRLARVHNDQVGLSFAIGMLGWLIAMREDFSRGLSIVDEALAIARATGHREALAEVLQGLGFMNRQSGRNEEAAAAFEESIAIRKRTGNLWPNAHSQHNLALIARREGDYDRAVRLHNETLPLFELLGDRGGVASTKNSLGLIALARGDHTQARERFEQALGLFRDLGDRGGVALALASLSRVALHLGDYADAAVRCRESLATRQEIGDKRGIAESLDVLAAIAAVGGDPLRAARLWGAAEGLRTGAGISLAPADREERDRAASAARANADEVGFSTAWDEGRALSLDQAVTTALAE